MRFHINRNVSGCKDHRHSEDITVRTLKKFQIRFFIYLTYNGALNFRPCKVDKSCTITLTFEWHLKMKDLIIENLTLEWKRSLEVKQIKRLPSSFLVLERLHLSQFSSYQDHVFLHLMRNIHKFPIINRIICTCLSKANKMGKLLQARKF